MRSAARAEIGCFISRSARSNSRPIIKNLKAVGLNKAKENSWARVVVEKPFGTRSRFGAKTESHRRSRFLGRSNLSDRSFPRQRDRAKHHGAAFRERDFRAALEFALHRSCSDHGRRNARRGGTRPAYYETARAHCATWCRITCCNFSASSRWSRRLISAPTAFAMRR